MHLSAKRSKRVGTGRWRRVVEGEAHGSLRLLSASTRPHQPGTRRVVGIQSATDVTGRDNLAHAFAGLDARNLGVTKTHANGNGFRAHGKRTYGSFKAGRQHKRHRTEREAHCQPPGWSRGVGAAPKSRQFPVVPETDDRPGLVKVEVTSICRRCWLDPSNTSAKP